MDEMGYVILQLFILMTMALILGRAFEKFRMPGLVGEIIVGIIFINIIITYPGIGEYIHFNLTSFDENETHFLNVMGELGVIFLLFTVGLETRFSDLLKVGRPALYIAVLGLVIPLICGFTYGIGLGYSQNVSLLIGTAMFAMSTAITIEVLRDLDAVNTIEGKIIIGAAVIDDILCLSMLAVISGIVDPDTNNATIIANTLIVIVFLIVAFSYISKIKKIAEKRKKIMMAERKNFYRLTGELMVDEDSTLPKTRTYNANKATLLAMIVCLGMATISSTIGLAGIIGSFLAGMMFAEFKDTYPCETNFKILTAFLLPFFFIYVGMKVRLNDVSASILTLLIGLIIVAIVTKYVGGYIGARLGDVPKDSSVVIGMSMIPRGEVGIIVATIGLNLGIFTNEMFTAVILMAIATSIIAPSLITWAYHRMERIRARSEQNC